MQQPGTRQPQRCGAGAQSSPDACHLPATRTFPDTLGGRSLPLDSIPRRGTRSLGTGAGLQPRGSGPAATSGTRSGGGTGGGAARPSGAEDTGPRGRCSRPQLGPEPRARAFPSRPLPPCCAAASPELPQKPLNFPPAEPVWRAGLTSCPSFPAGFPAAAQTPRRGDPGPPWH